MKSIRYGLMAVSACGFLLVIATAVVVFGVHRTNQLADRQEYVGEQLFATRQVFETVLSMETSQRGFLLTGDASYLDPYLREHGDLDRTIANFEGLFSEDAEARDRVAEISRLVRSKEAELAETVELARNGDRDGALEIVRGNLGKHVMDELRIKILSLVAQQRAVRTQFVYQAQETLRELYLLGAGVAVLIMILVGVAIRTLAVSIARLDDAQKAEEHNAMHDALTGLPNRRYLSEWLTTALAGAQRAGRELHLLYCDLDGFKGVNDRFGHEAGDRVLQATALRLRGTLRASDFVARIGGDEFVAALPDTGQAPRVPALVERIDRCLDTALIPELEDGAVTASIGTASFPHDGNTAPELLAAADRAMYAIKIGRHAPRTVLSPRERIANPRKQRQLA